MALLEKFLYLKKSQLPKAGKGLFCKVDIPKDTRIVEYKGRIREWKDVEHLDGDNPYLFYINSKTVINPIKRKNGFAHFANDARGPARVAGLRNNAEYDVKGKQCFIRSIRNIKKNEEIFVPYGKEYWDRMMEVAKEK
jgi:uncharacterized protein